MVSVERLRERLGEACNRFVMNRRFVYVYTDPTSGGKEFEGCKWPSRARGGRGSGEHGRRKNCVGKAFWKFAWRIAVLR